MRTPGVSCVVVLAACQTPSLTIERIGYGDGTVTSDPPGIECGPVCSMAVHEDAPIVLTATPAIGSVFVGWEDKDCLDQDPCTIAVREPEIVAARFELTRHALVVTRSGDGGGRISAPGISCGRYCEQLYPHGVVVVLEAIPAANARFAGWAGGGCGGADPVCRVTVVAPVQIDARFEVVPIADG